MPDAPVENSAVVQATVPTAEPLRRLSLFEMAAAPEEISAGIQKFRTAAAAVLLPADLVPISGHQFVRKSGWQRLAMTFGVHTEVAAVDRHPGAAEEGGAWRVTMRAVKGHCSVERSGLCTLAERKGKGKPGSEESTAMAMAETRAVGRAISALFGLGEVTAEEAAGMRPEDLQAIVTPAADAAYAAQADARNMQPPQNTATVSSTPPPPKPMPEAEVESLKKSRIAELKKMGFADDEIPESMLGISTLLGRAQAGKAKPASSHSPSAEAETKASPDGPGAAEANSSQAADPPSETWSKKDADPGSQEGAKKQGVVSSPPPAGPASKDNAGGENSSSSFDPKSPTGEKCECEGQDCMPSPPAGKADLDERADWLCLHCGGPVGSAIALMVLGRMRGAYTGLRTREKMTHQQAQDAVGYPEVPLAQDLSKPPTKPQLALLEKLNVHDKHPPETQAAAWGRAVALLRGKA